MDTCGIEKEYAVAATAMLILSSLDQPAGIANDTGEGFVDFIVLLHPRDDSILLLNPRASLRDEGETELNLGLVYRHKLAGRNVILGANAYLDRRESRHGNTFDQTGLGLEELREWVDARLNCYTRTTMPRWSPRRR